MSCIFKNNPFILALHPSLASPQGTSSGNLPLSLLPPSWLQLSHQTQASWGLLYLHRGHTSRGSLPLLPLLFSGKRTKKSDRFCLYSLTAHPLSISKQPGFSCPFSKIILSNSPLTPSPPMSGLSALTLLRLSPACVHIVSSCSSVPCGIHQHEPFLVLSLPL